MKTETISAEELRAKMEAGERVGLLDVRMPVEHREMCLEGSFLMPMDEWDASRVREWLGRQDQVVVICQSGKRAALAMDRLAKEGESGGKLRLLEGGLGRWKELGYPLERSSCPVFPIMRQVQLVASILVLTGIILALKVNLWFFALPVFVACGLTFAALTGKCGMAMLLAKMPWNRGGE